MTRLQPRRVLVLCGIGLAAGCGAEELSQSWELDRLRILGVQATPAEPQPGASIQFDTLIYVPEDETLGGAIWYACLPSGADEFGCSPDPELDNILDELSAFDDLKKDEFTHEDYLTLMDIWERAQAAGLVGFQDADGSGDLSWAAPADALDGLADAETLEGVSAVITGIAFLDGEDLNTDEVTDSTEFAYKRLPISLATTPNTNPELQGFDVEGTLDGDGLVQDGENISVAAGTTIVIEIINLDDTIEDYEYLNSSGETEERTEEPYVSWYSETGTLSEPYGLYPYTSVEWTAEDSAGTDQIIAVVRDRRGGMAWARFDISVSE